MINFITWGFKHKNDVIRDFFVVSTVSILAAWLSGLAVALLSMNLKAILVLLLPIIYAFIELYKLYRQERDECDK